MFLVNTQFTLDNIFDTYFKALQAHPLAAITEHSLRGELKALLIGLANKNTRILHEPKREGKFGSPDFKITNTESIVGYVENKKIGEDLDKVIKSSQIIKYQALSDNILVTNYTEWIWLREGKIQQREILCFTSDVENKRAKLNTEKVTAVTKLLTSFLSQPPTQITDTKKLAGALALRAKLLKDFLKEELERQAKVHTEGRLYQLYETFKNFIFQELSIEEFADAFAQNLVYGLFLAKLNAGVETINLYNAKKFIPLSFDLIRELVNFLDELDNEEYHATRWIVEEVLTIMNHLDLKAIQHSLSFTAAKKDAEGFQIKDPYVYFYEDFLAAYDKKLRKSRGVYYTPPQVVNFIVRAIDDLLINAFELKDGLANRNKVTVLDFATGTGTFLVEIFQQVLDKFPADHGKSKSIIKEHLLKNIFGFEYLIAPYTIAHLKMGQYLKDKGLNLEAKERLQVFLTNTLEPLSSQIKIPLMPALTEESKQAQSIKDKPILVITGNPPYSGESKNKGEWIVNELKDYFFVDGKPLGEKNSKWLNDDYVKFIRFAQNKMEEVDYGMVGIITNHSFIDNPTFRGMRQSLLNTFDQIYILDLHGNSVKKEKTPEGGKDENVFDIKQGVCISFFIKRKGLPKKTYHADYYGNRKLKYQLCLTDTLNTITWHELVPNSPFYYFVPQNQDLRKIYDAFFSVKEIFVLNSVGIVTARDGFTIHHEKQELKDTINTFLELNDEDARVHFNLGEDTRDWKITLAKKDLVLEDVDEKKMLQVHYRPFDLRYTYFTGRSKGFHCMPRGNVMKHMLDESNIGLAVGRAGQNVDSSVDWNLAFVCSEIIDFNLFYRGGELYFPLYTIGGNTEKQNNFSTAFVAHIKQLYKEDYIPEHILGYVYAILYCPLYRTKYAEFLKGDFPKIPFPKEEPIFKQLAQIGYELVCVHLKHDPLMSNEGLMSNEKHPIPDIVTKQMNRMGDFMGSTNNDKVEKIEYLPYQSDTENLFSHYYKNSEMGIIRINNDKYFAAVPLVCWEFQIGGYTVLQKYLKDRRNRDLSYGEIDNIEKMVRILHYTITQMQTINNLTKNWI